MIEVGFGVAVEAGVDVGFGAGEEVGGGVNDAEGDGVGVFNLSVSIIKNKGFQVRVTSLFRSHCFRINGPCPTNIVRFVFRGFV